LFAPPRADAAPPQGTPETYIVQPGDTLFAIALRYHTTVAAIKQLSGMGSSDIIQVGQKLLIPASDSPASTSVSASTLYIVQPGDTLYRIALRYGTPLRALEQLNGVASPNLIEPGQALAIPNNASVAKPGLIIEPPTARQGGTVMIRIARPDLALSTESRSPSLAARVSFTRWWAFRAARKPATQL
jgi:LysM repeat protein